MVRCLVNEYKSNRHTSVWHISASPSPSSEETMKLTLICLLIFVAAASTAPQFPASASPWFPVHQPFARNNKLSLPLVASGLNYPGQRNNIRMKDVLNPVTPVKPTPENESKPIELSSRTPTVAERSRCKQNYRKKEEEEEVIRTVVPFVVGGDISSKNQFPFLVALVLYNDKIKDYALHCGGSLISPTKILTAAHCVFGSTKVMDVDQFQVKLGMHFINDTSDDALLTRDIIKIKIHEDYDDSNTLNDIAILTLDSPVKYTNTISPICLVPSCLNDDNEQDVTAMGWGHTKFGGKSSDYLKSARLSTVPNDKCKETYKNSLVEDQMLCAYKEGQDTCQGDSGGPLVIDVNEGRQSGFEKSCRFMQVGIVSWGAGCAEKGIPGVYTRVKKYLCWISKHSSK